MNTQPRDKKGKFLKVRMNKQDWSDLLDSRWKDIETLQGRVNSERRAYDTVDYIRKQLQEENKNLWKRLERTEDKIRKQNIWSKVWASLAFVLGTIFFMIISKSK